MVNAQDVVPVIDAPIFKNNPNITLVDSSGDKIIIGIKDLTRASEIPDKIAGFEVSKVHFPRLKAHDCNTCSPTCDPKRIAKTRPIIGGISVGHYNITAGTIGCIVYDSSNKAYILSNNHVLANTSTIQHAKAKVGDAIYSPGCFSEDTRVLTEDGFKYFYELDYSDKICTLNPDTREIEYHTPSKIHSYEYNGKMILFSGQMYDQLVTPNHNLVVMREHFEEIEFITAKEVIEGKREIYNVVMELAKIYGNKYTLLSEMTGISKHTIKGWISYGSVPTIAHGSLQFIKDGIWVGEYKEIFEIPTFIQKGGRTKQITKFKMEDWVEFLGWYLSEGSLGGPYQESRGNYLISIRQMKSVENIDEIANVIIRMGFTPYVRYEHGSVTFNSKELHSYLEQFGHAKDKFIPKEIKNLSPHYLRILLKSICAGDGSFVAPRCDEYEDNYIGNPSRYFSISKRLAEDVAEIALKCGYGISIQRKESYATKLTISHGATPGTRHNDIYRVGISCRNLTPGISKKPQLENYSGNVYDVTVKNHILLIERNGKIVWSGNSADGGMAADTVATLSKWIPLDEDNPNSSDAAIAEILVSYQDGWLGSESTTIIFPNGFSDDVSVGDACYKYGRTTGYTENSIISTSASISVEYDGNVNILFQNQMIFVANPAYADAICGGDSGACLMNTRWNAIGLCFAGGLDDYGVQIGAANYISPILNAFGVNVPVTAEKNLECDPGVTKCISGRIMTCSDIGDAWADGGPSTTCGVDSGQDVVGNTLKALTAMLPLTFVLGIVMSGKRKPKFEDLYRK